MYHQFHCTRNEQFNSKFHHKHSGCANKNINKFQWSSWETCMQVGPYRIFLLWVLLIIYLITIVFFRIQGLGFDLGLGQGLALAKDWPWPRGLSKPKFCGLCLGLNAPGLCLGLGLVVLGLDLGHGLEGPGLVNISEVACWQWYPAARLTFLLATLHLLVYVTSYLHSWPAACCLNWVRLQSRPTTLLHTLCHIVYCNLTLNLVKV